MKKWMKDPLIRLMLATKPIAGWLILGGILDISAVLCAVAAPELLGDLVQQMYDYDGVQQLAGSLLPGLGALLFSYALYGLLSYCNMLLMNNVVSRYFSCGLRIQMSEKIKFLPVSYVDQTPVGDILRRMTGDVSEMGGYVHQIFDTMIKGVFQLLLITVVMFLEDWRLALFVVVLMPLSLLLSSKIAGISEKHYDAMFQKSGEITELVEECFSNYATTKAYNLEEYTCEKHRKINMQERDITVRANFIGSIVQPLIKLMNAFSYITISLVGGYLIAEHGVGVGIVVAIVLYSRQFSSPLEQLAYGFSQMNRVRSAAKRVFAVLDMAEEDDSENVDLPELKGEITVKDLSFSYNDEPLIENMNIRVNPGQKIAIVGPTGAGKTTIVNLLMRFYDPDSGKILLDGRDISAMSRAQVRDQFAMVLQDTWLFRGTISENVAYGRNSATIEEIQQACIQTHCDHFIRTLPDGYNTIIGEDTTNLSGGQKQLLTIARAFLSNKPLLILDEATSNVDTRTEVLIQQAMDRLMKGKTCFVIAHRLSTIVNSDLILVMDHGKIIEHGTHTELLQSRGFYYDLYTSQYAV